MEASALLSPLIEDSRHVRHQSQQWRRLATKTRRASQRLRTSAQQCRAISWHIASQQHTLGQHCRQCSERRHETLAEAARLEWVNMAMAFRATSAVPDAERGDHPCSLPAAPYMSPDVLVRLATELHPVKD